MIYLIVAFCGLFLTLFLVYPVQWLARSLGAIAAPGGRSIHKEPTPLLGGIAIYLSLVIVGAVIYFYFPETTIASSLFASKSKLFGLLAGSTFLLFVGIIDDIKPMRARTKLLGQFFAIGICVVSGFTIPAISIPFFGSLHLGVFGPILFVFWVLAITNAINLIDGMDGLASTVGLVSCIGNGIAALLMGYVFIAFFSFLMAGCLIGFLFHNFPPAKIFLGDTGSMLIGFLLAVIVLESNLQKRSTTLVILAPLILLGFSLLDVALAIVRRFIRGKPIFSSDLGHIHHRLMAKFNNPRRVLLVVTCFSFIMMGVSLTILMQRHLPSWFVGLVAFVAVLGLAFFVRLLGFFRVDKLRYIIDNREEVKFFVSLLSLLRVTLPKVQNRNELVAELDWVCQALKPHRVLFLGKDGSVVYCHASSHLHRKNTNVYQDAIENGVASIKWTCSTMNEDPEMCDVRLLWRELFVLFKKEWSRIQDLEQKQAEASISQEEVIETSERRVPTLKSVILRPKSTASINS